MARITSDMDPCDSDADLSYSDQGSGFRIYGLAWVLELATSGAILSTPAREGPDRL